MSAPNFSYSRRCVLVPGEAIDCDNAPEHSKCFDNNRSYPSYILDEYEDDFSTIAIVLTYGYYSDACIDIVDDDSLVSELSCSDWYFSHLTREELFEELCSYFHGNISKRMMLRHLKGLNRRSEDYLGKLAKAVDAIFEEVRDKEVKMANKYVDKIKRAYGFPELRRTAIFSNGEAWYDYAK